ncbi:hypothetical protein PAPPERLAPAPP_00760 [Brevundimonas phage vB_BpoS-Papperlapapp]|uniref:Uncharacterized protein n=1 Tax=Brevundimonas phage vB_BpoS-Domovoi TaxID=2948598 RepID=A0A9E7MRY0_9CAUD|nr:hypothetical protein DOMOVOI_05540 [Brevundimonas phage vB_BpoS-Domovoi]USN15818.1 hypothetical protein PAPPERLAPAPP_00760 [Brevundimonas phage vB_BpoS-Papperlapapp]
MISFNGLLRISAGQIRDHWSNFSRKAYVEPLVIVDGYHRYVLMSEEDYKALTEAPLAKTPPQVQ